MRVDDKARFIVKCGNGATGPGTISHEAIAYDWLERQTATLPFRPTKIAWLAKDELLILEAIDPAITVGVLAKSSPGLSPRRAGQIGKALAALHSIIPDEGSIPELPRDWFLSVHLPTLVATENMSLAALEMTKRIQNHPDLCTDLDSLSEYWQPSALTNSDIKWDNILYRRKGVGAGSRQPIFIDWEFLGIGDPAWDLAAVLAEYLFAWTHTRPDKISDPKTIDIALSYELDQHLDEIAAFWQAYVTVSDLTPVPANELLLRATRFTGGRLILRCFEAMQETAQFHEGMNPTLQLAANLLDRPAEAVVHLFGLPIYPNSTHG